MTGRRTLPCPAVRRDAGVTVVELTVAMAIAALLLAAIGGVYTGVLRTIRSVNSSAASNADGRVAMEAVSRTLRVAYKPDGYASAFTAASANGVTFYALLNRSGAPSVTEPAPTLVSYSYVGGCLQETQTRAGVTRKTCLVRTTVAPVFTYYPSPGLVSGGTPVAPIAGNPIAGPDLGTIESVGVTLDVLSTGQPAQDAVHLVNRVTLTNLVPGAGA